MIFKKIDNFDLEDKHWMHPQRVTTVNKWFINKTGHRILILDMPDNIKTSDNAIPVYIQGEGVRLASWFRIMHLDVSVTRETSASAMWLKDVSAFQSTIDEFDKSFIKPNQEYSELYQSIIDSGLKVYKIENRTIIAPHERKARRIYRRITRHKVKVELV